VTPRRALVHLQRRQRPQYAHPLDLGELVDGSGGQRQQARCTHAEHARGHVGTLDVATEPPHVEHLVAGHRGLQDAVEAPALVDHTTQETVAPTSLDRRDRRAAHVDRQVVDGLPRLARQHLAAGAQVLPALLDGVDDAVRVFAIGDQELCDLALVGTGDRLAA
jgi:hypothetical protein